MSRNGGGSLLSAPFPIVELLKMPLGGWDVGGCVQRFWGSRECGDGRRSFESSGEIRAPGKVVTIDSPPPPPRYRSPILSAAAEI